MVFGEDASRIRKGYGPANWTLLRRLSLNLLRQDETVQDSLKGKRKQAGWDNRILESVLGF